MNRGGEPAKIALGLLKLTMPSAPLAWPGLAWISYPNPGRPGAELHRDWLVRAFRQYGVC